ncbi:MAG: superoxide dismutase [Phycisphaerae bacterium]|nr:superoxide dismutase [Phycisphaerae bacterium]
MSHALPGLPYATNALEPFIDAKTMEIHHGKHHAAYVTNANKALEGTRFADMPADQVIAHLSDLPEDKRNPVRNNLGGHINHSMFWKIMAPKGQGGGGEPSGDLLDALNASFGSVQAFRDQFHAAALARFGSGWVWLCVKPKQNKLALCHTANQDTPLMGESVAGCGGIPIMGLDVWEHAYYLNYQNRRPDYVMAWWNVVNWSEVAKNLRQARV